MTELNGGMVVTKRTLQAVRTENQLLRSIVEGYADHAYPCDARSEDDRCTCGFTKAMAKLDASRT